MRNNTTTSGATSEPSANRGSGTSGGHADVEHVVLTAKSARAPPLDTVMSRAPAERAPRAISSVSSVSPEYDTANARVRGPTNAGVR